MAAPPLIRAAADPSSRNYGFIEGEPSLRAAYTAHLSAFYHAHLSSDQVMITSGYNQAFITTALTLTSLGDQVLMQSRSLSPLTPAPLRW